MAHDLNPPLPRRKARKEPLGRESWLKAARTALIREGIGGVEVGKLARKLRASRGGFYWFFSGIKQLLNELLSEWAETNTAGFKAILQGDGGDGVAEYKALVDLWVNESGYDPQWDAAVREWARISPRVAAVVRRVDDVRIGIIQRIFQHLGFEDPEAFVRARTTYFLQIGYYTLGVQESHEQRVKFAPIYTRILTGKAC